MELKLDFIAWEGDAGIAVDEVADDERHNAQQPASESCQQCL